MYSQLSNIPGTFFLHVPLHTLRYLIVGVLTKKSAKHVDYSTKLTCFEYVYWYHILIQDTLKDFSHCSNPEVRL